MSLNASLAAIAKAHGWGLDTSPGTELSNDTWYRHSGTLALKREDELEDLISTINTGEETE